jgi:hypothetical protein
VFELIRIVLKKMRIIVILLVLVCDILLGCCSVKYDEIILSILLSRVNSISDDTAQVTLKLVNLMSRNEKRNIHIKCYWTYGSVNSNA